jgi:DNA-binding LytR/AlgR family response regulator
MLTPVFAIEKGVLKKMHPEEIVYFESKKNYIDFYLLDGTKVNTRSTLHNALKKLPRGMFIKVSRSKFASIFYINSIVGDELLVFNVSLTIKKPFQKAALRQLTVIGSEAKKFNGGLVIS